MGDRGGIVLWEEAGCKIEGEKNYGPNMITFTVMLMWKKWFVIVAYVPTNNQPSVQHMEQALARWPVMT